MHWSIDPDLGEDATKATSGTSLCSGSCSSKAPGRTKIQTEDCARLLKVSIEVRDHAGSVSENLVVRFWKPKTETKRKKMLNKAKVKSNILLVIYMGKDKYV